MPLAQLAMPLTVLFSLLLLEMGERATEPSAAASTFDDREYGIEGTAAPTRTLTLVGSCRDRRGGRGRSSVSDDLGCLSRGHGGVSHRVPEDKSRKKTTYDDS